MYLLRRARNVRNSGEFITIGPGDPKMYNQFFALRENPFNVNPDPRYLFLNRQTAEARDALTQGIQARKGLLLLTGEVGTGKTTLLNHLLDWLHQQRAPTAFIFNSHLEINHLFEFMLSDFAVKFDPGLKDNTLLRLHQWLWERYRAGDTPVVIVDEAQGLPDRVLEEIRMLLNLETSNEKLLQIVLAGQPELEARLQQPELRQVKQRIALRCKTAALSLDETHQYIQLRLHIAGADGPRIFAPEAIEDVHFYSRGIPRVINLLCEHALINAGAAQVRPVPARFIAEVASEFQFDDARPLAPSSNFAEAPSSQGIPAESRFLNALVSLSTRNQAQPNAPEFLDPSGTPASRGLAAPDNSFSPVQGSAASLSHRERFQGASADNPVGAAPSPQCSEPGCSLSSEQPVPPLFAQVFGSPLAHAFAIRSAHALAPSSEPAIALPSTQILESCSASDFAASHEQDLAPRSEPAFASGSGQIFVTSAEPFNAQRTPPAAPWHRQLEARLLADWTSFFSEVGSSLASDPAAEPASEPVAATHPPRLHLVETKSAPAVSPAAGRRLAPNFQNSARLASRADAAKSIALISPVIKLVALRRILIRWLSTVNVRLLSPVVARSRTVLDSCTAGAAPRLVSARTAAARSRAMAYLTQLRTRGQSFASWLYWVFVAFVERCLKLATSIDWSQLWLTASRWLRQPCDPTQWRLHDLRPFHELLRFNHKKT